jgi:hypothetical protein
LVAPLGNEAEAEVNDCNRPNTASFQRKGNVMNRSLLIAAVSGIVLGGSLLGSVAHAESTGSGKEPAAKDGKHSCKGQNACKGQGGCKTEKHACKAQNACKGQGGCKG